MSVDKKAKENVVVRLFKLAYHLDLQGQYDEAKEIEKVMESLAERVGLSAENMLALADYMDQEGHFEAASAIDSMCHEKIVQAKAKHRPPKKWFDKMKKEIKKGNPKYSEERVNQTIGDIWYNNLSDEKRREIYKRHGEKKDPNK